MSDIINISTVTFTGNQREANVKNALYQYDYGQIIVIDGLELPQAFEVHFCNVGGDNIERRIGVNNAIEIPNEYLTSGADIVAYFYLHASNSDGRTRYIINIPVEERQKPSDVIITDEQKDVIALTIDALNDAVEQTSADVEATSEHMQSAEIYAANAEQYAQDAAQCADDAASARFAAEGILAQVKDIYNSILEVMGN